MKGKIFLVLLLGCLAGGTIFALSNASIVLKGIFPIQNGWSGNGGTSYTGGGYPGKVNFDVGSGQIMADGTLSGSFWLGNVGWTTFTHGVIGSTPQVNCPTDVWSDATQPCPVSGYAWSQNAGWIAMAATDIGSGSGVYFDPNTGNLSGWGWSRSLGWIPMWTSVTTALLPDATTLVNPLAGVPINFVSRIAIVGNIAGSRIFSVANNGIVNQDVGYSYKSINHAAILNMLHKNIALMTRNIDDADLDPAATDTKFDFIVRKGSDLRIESSSLTPYLTAKKRSLIVIGGDIIIDETDVNSLSWSQSTIALVALKDAAGKGGNIVISQNAKRIYAYMYAEGSVFSGEKVDNTHPIIPYTASGVWNTPEGQLYIRGLVVSKNTIGGAQQKPTAICPTLVPECFPASNSYIYDWDYFRTYDNTDPTQPALPIERSGIVKLQNATMIIEYDDHILTDPPPGFRDIR